MSGARSNDSTAVPFMQRLYDRIWLLAVAALLFFVTVYVVWGVVDIMAVPGG